MEADYIWQFYKASLNPRVVEILCRLKAAFPVRLDRRVHAAEARE
jgi:hypothetical protein